MINVSERIDGVAIGILIGFEEQLPLVVFAGNRRDVAVRARSLVTLDRNCIGAEVALAFEDGNPERPLVLGRIVEPDQTRTRPEVVEKNGRVVIQARDGIELRCGKASIVMHPDGRITIRGSELVSHASAGNRIRGGSISLN